MFVTLHETTTTTGVLQALFTVHKHSCTDDEFDDFFEGLESLYERCDRRAQRFCIVYDVRAPFSHPGRLRTLVRFLQENRTITRRLSTHTCVVLHSPAIQAIFERVLSWYSPVGHVQVCACVEDALAFSLPAILAQGARVREPRTPKDTVESRDDTCMLPSLRTTTGSS